MLFFFCLAVLFSQKAFAQPTISSFSPTSAAVGETITITGTNFSAVVANNHVVIGGIKATITSASSTSLTITVPAGIVSNAPISVLNKTTHLWVISKQVFKPAFTSNKPILINADLNLEGVPNSDDPGGLYGFATADFNDDGKLDLVFSDNGTQTKSIYVRRNITTTSVAFAAAVTLTESGLQQVGKLLAIADLDGDAKPDVIVPGMQSNNVAIFRNTSVGATISFTSVVESAGLSGTFATVAADFDGDGKIDIASAANGINRLIVSTNTSPGPGTITFNSTTLSLGSSDFYSLAVADINDDGKPDIIGVTAANNVEVYRNTSTPGSMSFVLTTVSSIITQAFGMVVGDIDGDTKPDIIVNSQASSPYNNQFATLRNTSVGTSITFSQVNVSVDPSPAAGYSQDYPALADINGDGKLDYIVCLNYANAPTTTERIHRVAVFNNTSTTGSISFFPDYVARSTGSAFLNIHGTVLAADFNSDGKPDIMAALNSNARFAIFTNSLQFAPTISSIAPLTVAPNSNVVITGTGFNATTTNNIVEFGGITGTVSSASTTSLTVKVPLNASYAPISVLNTGNTLAGLSGDRFLPAFTPNKSALAATDFVQQANFSVTGDLYGMAAGDLTGDGKPELVVTNSSSNSLMILGNISTTGGPVAFGAATAFTPTSDFSGPRFISLADIDGNGWLDIVIPSYSLSKVGVFLNTGTGVVSTSFTLTGSYVTGMGPNGVATGDLDGDGKPDIVTANNGASSVSVLRNTSIDSTRNIRFDAKQDYQISAGEAIFSVALADLDNDGKLDIIASRDINSAYGKIVLLRNTSTIGNISFTTTGAGEVNGPKAPWNFVPGDLNGDGLTDFVASSAGSGATEVFAYTKLANGGALTNLSITQLDVTKANKPIGLADLNGDGKPDLVSATSNSIPGYRTYIYPNTTTGTTTSFGTRIELPASALPWSTVITDMNADGKPDIVMGNQLGGESTISIYRNTLIAPPVTQASGITVTSLTGTTATFSWTNGSGAKRAVFIKEDNTGSAIPVAGTDYTANTAFGSGSQIGSTGWFCVYNGTGNLVNVTGFTPSTSYRVMVTEFNDGGLSNTAQYNTNTATNNPLTVTARATVTAISRTAASATINTTTADFRVSFNAAMTNLTTANFSLSTTGITGASVTSVAGSGTVFTVTANTGTGNGTIGLNLANTTGMVPGVTNTLSYIGEVYTIDKTPPTLSPVTIVSNNSNTSRAKVGDVITLNFTSSEAINAPSATIAGNAATVSNVGGNDWKAVYTMAAGDAGGVVSFSISFSDLPGNAGTAVTATTNSSSVTFDKTNPTLSTVTIVSNNANTALAKAGDVITLNFTADETVATPSATIAGNAATVSNISGNDWKAVYTMATGDATGVVSFSISFSDITGNAGTAVTATTNSSSINFDKTSPTLSTVTIVSNNANTALAKTGDVITLNFTSNEGIATPSATIAGNAATVSNTGGNNWKAVYTMAAGDANGVISFNILFSDVTGNAGTAVTATTNSSTVTFDKTIPTLSAVTIVSNNANTALAKTGDVITLNFTSNEGIATPSAIIAGNAATVSNTGGNNWKAVYTMAAGDANGVISFNISFSDVTGNAGTAVTATTNSSTVTFDKTIPTLSAVTIVSNNANTALAKTGDQVTVNFTSSETIVTPSATIAGNAATISNVSGNSWKAVYTMAAGDASGVISFSISFSDVTGNAGTAVTATTNSSTVTFDKTSPTLSTVTIVSNNANTALAKTGDQVTVNFTANETIATPSATIAGNAATISNVSGNNWKAVYMMAAGDAGGVVSFSISFSDAAGNAGTAVTATTNSSNVIFDKTAPALSTVTIASNNANTGLAKTGDIITVNFTSSESILTPSATIAGNTALVSNVSGNNWKAVYTMAAGDAAGVVSFSISFSDLAGNIGTAVTTTTNSSSVNFDKTTPILSTVTIASNNANTALAKTGDQVTLNFTSSETISAPTATIAGNAATVSNVGGNNWKAVYTMTASDANGIVLFNISFSDLTGNTGTASATTNNSNVTFDKTAPLLTTVSISSNNANTAFAKTGDAVTLTFTSNETLTTPIVTIAGNAVIVTNTSGNNYSAAYTMVSGDASGTVPFSIAFGDIAGNAGSTVTATTNSSTVIFDKTAPVVSSINRQVPLTQDFAGSSSVTYRVTFSEAVKNVSASAFQLTQLSGSVSGTIASVSATTGSVIDVTVNNISGNGSFRLDLKNSGTGITDNAGNAISGGFTSGQSYGNNTAPVITGGATLSLVLCQGLTTATSIGNLLAATDVDNGQTLTWTVLSGPSHGTLSGFPTSLTVVNGSLIPAGVTYTADVTYSGADVFTIQVSDGIASVTTTVNVTVNALPVVTLNASQGTILCGTGATLNIDATAGNTYTWYRNGAVINGVSSAQLTANSIGVYNATATSAAGCSANTTNSITITQLQKPTVDFSFDSYCINNPVSFTNKSVTTNSGPVTYAWTSGNGNTSTSASPVFTYTQSGSYTAKLKVTPTSCPSIADSISKVIQVEIPTAGIRLPAKDVEVNKPAQLEARTFAASYNWVPRDGLSATNIANPMTNISGEVLYTIAMKVASGCTTTDTLQVRVFWQNTIMVANVFTPNGDGVNDKLIVNLVGVKNFHFFRVFNKQGKKIFETNNPFEGWDGKLNGVLQPMDTYVWIAEGTDQNGAIIHKQGSSTLIR